MAPPFDTRPPRDPREHERLDTLLYEWSQWQQSGALQGLRCSTTHYWARSSSDCDGMLAEADIRDARAVDAAIWDLSPLLRMSVMVTHLAATWRPNRPAVNLDETYQQARLALSRGLKRRQVP